MATSVRTADFEPEYSLTGDFKKISEYSFLEHNSLILPILTMINMVRGQNQLVPDMGLKDILDEIPYTEESGLESIIKRLNDGLNKYSRSQAKFSVDYSKTDFDSGDAYLLLDIYGIPKPIEIHVSRQENSSAKVFNIIDGEKYPL